MRGPLEQYGEPQIELKHSRSKGGLIVAVPMGTYSLEVSDGARKVKETAMAAPAYLYSAGYPYPKLGSSGGVIAVVALPKAPSPLSFNELILSGPTVLHLKWQGGNRIPLLLLPGHYEAKVKAGDIRRSYSFEVTSTTRQVSMHGELMPAFVPKPGKGALQDMSVRVSTKPEFGRPVPHWRMRHDADPYSFPIVVTRPKYGINSGLFIFYANPISPPYRVQAKDRALFLNGIQIAPQRWEERGEYPTEAYLLRANEIRRRLMQNETIITGGFSGGEGNGGDLAHVMPIMLDTNTTTAGKAAQLTANVGQFRRADDARNFVAHFSTANWRPGKEEPLPETTFPIDFDHYKHSATTCALHSPNGFQMLKEVETLLAKDRSSRMTRRVAGLVTDPRFVDRYDQSSQKALDTLLAKYHRRMARELVAMAEEHIDDHRNAKYLINSSWSSVGGFDIENAYARPLKSIQDPAAVLFLKSCLNSESERVREHAAAALKAMGKFEGVATSSGTAAKAQFGQGDHKYGAYPAAAYLEFKDSDPDGFLEKVENILMMYNVKRIRTRQPYGIIKNGLDLDGVRDIYEIPLERSLELAQAVAELGLVNESSRNWLSLEEIEARIAFLETQLKSDERIFLRAPSTAGWLKAKLVDYQWLHADLKKHRRRALLDISVLKIR